MMWALVAGFVLCGLGRVVIVRSCNDDGHEHSLGRVLKAMILANSTRF